MFIQDVQLYQLSEYKTIACCWLMCCSNCSTSPYFNCSVLAVPLYAAVGLRSVLAAAPHLAVGLCTMQCAACTTTPCGRLEKCAGCSTATYCWLMQQLTNKSVESTVLTDPGRRYILFTGTWSEPEYVYRLPHKPASQGRDGENKRVKC